MLEPVPTLGGTLTWGSGITFTPEVTQLLHQQELREGELSPHSEQWLVASLLTPDQMPPLPEKSFPFCNHLGTPLALLNQQGEADWQAEFDPWGNQVDGRNPKKLYQPIRMQGQHYDEETGLHYNRHRYYDPMLGRYITQDPIGLRGGMNLYQYPLDPILHSDPLGLMEFGKWVGSAVNAASEGNMSYEQAAAAIGAASGPYYKPPSGSISLDAGISLDAFSGGSVVLGITVGTNDKASGNKDICAYYAQCDHSGAGLAMGVAASLSASEAGVSPGQTDSKGAMMGGGLLGKFSIAGTKDSSGNRTGILSVGPGIGAWVGELSNCSQHSKCLSELLG